MYRHIFFDLDHTLWDFDKNAEVLLKQLYQSFKLKERGVDEFDEFLIAFHYHNERLWARYRSGFIKRDDFRFKRMWHTLLDFRVGDTQLANELGASFFEYFPQQRNLFPGAKELLAYCASKYSLHIITNGFEITQRQKLYNCDILPFFTHIITSEKSNSVKPKKEIFDYAQSLANAAISECVMVGDNLNVDILGGQNAGWDTIYFNPKKNQHEGKTTFEVATLSEIVQIL
ncbi:MAG: noncanonical pyrimidine nucleotidase, YjjG family [Chitinophagaceae bacterium]|nr:noncanonical pyrimidine nucleotidase, YjjG family [Chitinophagaceae bacterium]